MSGLLLAPTAPPYVPPPPFSGFIPLYNAAGAGKGATTSPVSFTDAVPVDTAASVVWVLYSATTATPTVTAAIGSTSGVLIAVVALTTANPFYYLAAYLVLNPPTGTPTSACTFSALATCSLETIHYKYVSVALAAISVGVQSGQPSIAISSTIPGVLYTNALGYRLAATGNTFTGYSFLQRYLVAGVVGINPPLLIGDQPGSGGTLTALATRSDITNTWGGMVVPLVPPVAYFGGAGVGSGSKTSSPATDSDIVPVGTTCAVIWVAYYTPTSNTATLAASLGGTAATLVYQLTASVVGTNTLYLCCYVLFNPPSGTQTVSFSASTGSFLTVLAAEYYNNVVALGTPIVSGLNAGNPSMSVSASNSNYIYANAFAYGAATTAGETFSGYTQNQRYIQALVSSGCRPLLVGDAQGNGDTLLFGATRTGSENSWGGIILPLAPPICIDQVSASVSWAAASNTFIHNAIAGSDLYVAVTTIDSDTFVSAVCGSTTMTVLGQVNLNNVNTSSAGGQLTLCHLADVPGGPLSITVTKSAGSHSGSANSISYLNVNATSTPVTVFGSGTTASQTTTMPTGGQRILQIFGVDLSTFTASSGGAQRGTNSFASHAGQLVLDAIATATMTGTIASSDDWAGMSVILS